MKTMNVILVIAALILCLLVYENITVMMTVDRLAAEVGELSQRVDDFSTDSVRLSTEVQKLNQKMTDFWDMLFNKPEENTDLFG